MQAVSDSSVHTVGHGALLNQHLMHVSCLIVVVELQLHGKKLNTSFGKHGERINSLSKKGNDRLQLKRHLRQT